MKFFPVFLLFLTSLLNWSCDGKKKDYVSTLAYGEIHAAANPSPLPLAEDEYLTVDLDPEGKVLLYIVTREVKEGWGFGHGNELVSYDLERKMKLPLGKLGRSTLVKVIQLGDDLKNAVVRTVDTDGNGDIDERDANQLYLTAPCGLDEEPVSQIGKNVVGVWQDPLKQWVVFATSDDWPGRKKRVKEKPPDPTPVAWAWDTSTKGTQKLAVCDKFYGFSPDGLQFGCLVPGQKGGGELEVAIYARDTLKVARKIKLPVTAGDQVFLLGGDRVIFSKLGSAGTRMTSTLWVRGPKGGMKQVTNPSVDSRIMSVLSDGTVLFLATSIDSVDDFVAARALSPDGREVKTVFKYKGSDIDSIALSAGGQKLTYLKRDPSKVAAPGEAQRGKIIVAGLEKKAGSVPTARIAGEAIAGLGDSILKGVRDAAAAADFVELMGISVDIHKKIVTIPVKPAQPQEGASPDDLLVQQALKLKALLAPVLAEERCSIVVSAPAPKDAVAIVKWLPEYGGYYTFLSAYGEFVPVREEYKLAVEDLSFRKMPGCKDPRLIQLHCGGWLAATGDVKAGGLAVKCKAEPLNPMQFMREETVMVQIPVPGGDAVEFEVVVDKVDPRRSNRYSYYLALLADGKPFPYYDALWASASTAWIALMRKLGAELPSSLIPYSGRAEALAPLAKWRPDSVVNREAHLDVHLFLEPSPKLPPIENREAWQALAHKVMEDVTAHATTYDQGRENDVRVELNVGNDLAAEDWHKSAAEIIEQKMIEDPNWEPPIPGEEAKDGKGKGKPKTKEEKELLDLMEEALGTKVPVAKLGLPKAMIDKKEIQKVIALHMKEVKYCYEKEAAVKELASGQISVKFVIDARGSVQSAVVSSATLKNKPVQDCVLKAAQRWKFPKPEGEGTVIINYPFTFTSGK